MLKKALESDREILLDFLPKGIIPARIASYVLSYGFDKSFLDFWICYEEEKIHSVIAMFEDNVTVYSLKNSDLSEMISFLSMLSFKTLICEKKTAGRLGFGVCEEKQGFVFEGVTDEISAKDIEGNDLRAVYRLISENIPDSFKNNNGAYLSFLSDYTYRNRRNCGRGKCIKQNDKLISCAITSAESLSEAILSGVASDKSVRKGGYGKKTVLSLVNELQKENKTAYVIALNESACGFYEHIGFKKTEKIAYIRKEQ